MNGHNCGTQYSTQHISIISRLSFPPRSVLSTEGGGEWNDKKVIDVLNGDNVNGDNVNGKMTCKN